MAPTEDDGYTKTTCDCTKRARALSIGNCNPDLHWLKKKCPGATCTAPIGRMPDTPVLDCSTDAQECVGSRAYEGNGWPPIRSSTVPKLGCLINAVYCTRCPWPTSKSMSGSSKPSNYLRRSEDSQG
jgi:hypothetical protein